MLKKYINKLIEQKLSAPIDVKVKYLTDITPLDFVEGCKSDLIDLRSAETIEYKKGDAFLLHLGVCIEVPEGFTSKIYARSSLSRKKYIMIGNSVGCMDQAFKGDNDEWLLSCVAIGDGRIEFNERVCQFEIQRKMPEVNFHTVSRMNSENRGGYGSTGNK